MGFSLIDYYKEMWNNKDIADMYWQCGSKAYGNILWFMNTNFRTVSPAFTKAYASLLTEEGHKPSEFAVVPTHQQSKVKQMTVRLRQTWLYYVDAEGRYQQTKRGKVFYKAMLSESFTKEEKDILCYFFLLSADFNNESKYLLSRTTECFNHYKNAGYSVEEILLLQEELIREANKDRSTLNDLAKLDYFYIANLYQPYRKIDFLTYFKQSSEKEIKDLKAYVCKNLDYHNSNCILSKKYETSGNFNKPMLVECTWILYLTKKILSLGNITFEKFIDSILKFYSYLYYIDIEKVKNFISEHSTIFEAIYNVVYDINISNGDTALSQAELSQMDVVDPTDLEGQIKQNQVSEALKQLAKEKTNYHCVLEDFEDCSSHYFTSKKEQQNYLEVHHFIPREFASEFDSSLEILDNYIALCPCCHRKIHHAVDRERKSMIINIFNQRKEVLANHGISIADAKKILEYYKFDQE